MWTTKFVLFGALALILVSQASASDKIEDVKMTLFSLYDDYLQVPDLSELDNEYHTNVREAILKLDFNQETTPEQLKEMIIQSRDADNSPHKEVYSTLVTFFHSTGKVINESLIRVVKSILAQIRAKKNDRLALFGQIFKEVFSERVDLLYYIRDSMEYPQDVEELDRLFYAAWNFDRPFRKIVYEKLTRKLTLLNMAKHNMDVKSMIKVAAKSESSLFGKKEESLDVLKANIDKNCDNLEKFKETFDILNLVIAFGVEEPIVDYERRRNEYHRLCLAWNKPETREKILQNIKKQLQDDDSATSAKV